MSEKLERCPFCGGDVDFWTKEADEAEEYQALIIECVDCPANMEEWVYKYDKNFAENFEKKKAEMFEAWNKRAERTVKGDKLSQVERTAKVEKVTRVSSVIRTGRCGDCGYDVIDSYKHCPNCGAKLDWSEMK